MKVEALKEKARRHEQKEDWQKALDLYREALHRHDEDEPPDITLYNRVGDIQTRLGQLDGAVESYELAIDLYLEAELPNNAIAVCKKVLRNLPDRRVFFLRMGQIRGRQGFLTDARQNFLTYAEMATGSGDMDGALDALVEFVELAPEDLEIRMGLASQLEAHGRVDEAVPQYVEGYRHMVLQDMNEEAQGLAEKIREMAPDTMLPDAQSIRAGAAGKEEEIVDPLGSLAGLELGSGFPAEVAPVEEVEVEFGEIDTSGGEEQEEEKEREETPAPTPEPEAVEEVAAGLEVDAGGEGEEEDVGALPTFGLSDEEPATEEEAPALPSFGFGDGAAGEEEEEEEDVVELPTFDFEEEEEGEPLPTLSFDDEEEDEAGEPLPALAFEEEEEDEGAEDEAAALPTFGFEGEAEVEVAAGSDDSGLSAEDFGEADYGDRGTREYVEEGEPLPDLEVSLDVLEGREEPGAPAEALEEALEDSSFEAGADTAEAVTDEEAVAEEEAVVQELPPETAPRSHEEAAGQGNLDLALEMLQAQIAARPDDVELYQRKVEYAFRKADHAVLIPAYMDLAGALVRTAAPAKAKSIYQQVLSLSPGHQGARDGLLGLEGETPGKAPSQVASSEEYVDLGSMILGEEAEKTTRWQVTADAPSGDDQADFAKMLSQFKQKVSEHVDADDVSAHHDLGTAYMEMGLLDEAISEFQMALRASPDHLPTHEVMGRSWLEMGKADMAVRALRRALEVPFDVEDELIGIYYLMGRAQEELGNGPEAVEFYDKVFSLDINFEDVTERLRNLRED